MNLCVVATKEVWMEGAALEQLERAAALPGCVRAVGMPDLHPGPGGMPIGAALAFEDAIYPGLVGSDVGCGVRVVLTRLRRPSLDRLERRLRADAARPWCEVPGLLEILLARGVAGLADLGTLPASLRLLAAAESPEEPLNPATLCGELLAPSFAEALGTLGGGNHFAEVAFVSELSAPEVLGNEVARDRLAVLVHSGSRGLGRALADHFGTGRLTSTDAQDYLAAHAWACRFARANRWLLAWQLLAAAEAARPVKQVAAVECVHNQVTRQDIEGRTLWLHRKGAAPAEQGRLTVVLGSRGAPSRIMRGTGLAAGLESVAHGAGRRMTRAEALGKMRVRYPRATLGRTALGSRVLCDRTETLYEEHPDVYKPIEPVIDSIIAGGLATPVATLTPLVTVKQ